MTDHDYTPDPDDLLARIRAIGVEENIRELRLRRRGRYSDRYEEQAQHLERLEQLAILIFALDVHLAHGGPLPEAWATRTIPLDEIF
ncbi:hypothetical protein [Nocardia takedensis]|uniref:hypothetical protein n=1 Tax=Nocardia takedensis TaxID=259390 RepID=UPI00030DE56E|nr:hypothetical protein [Nocardia takedensis]